MVILFYIPVVGGRGYTLWREKGSMWTSNLFMLPSISLSWTSSIRPYMEAGAALRSARPRPAVPQRGAFNTRRPFYRWANWDHRRKIRQGNRHETTSYTEAIKLEKEILMISQSPCFSGNWSSEKSGYLTRVTQLVHGRVRSHTWIFRS